MSFGIGLACLGAAACFLLPAYYVNPTVGNGFVLIAFTIVVLGGMGSFVGALAGGFIIGVVESLGGLLAVGGESSARSASSSSSSRCCCSVRRACSARAHEMN